MVGIVARDTPLAICLTSPPPVRARTLNTSIMPVTVPSSHRSGHRLTIVAIIAVLVSIFTMVSLCPLLGLLGTVTGMIEVFNVLALTGGGDVKQMASGVSRATIPTMAGMVAALSGLFANTYIERIASREKRLFADHLTMDH